MVNIDNSGVYIIRNVLNQKVYVGSASSTFHARWKQHRWELRRGTHHSPHLQKAWIKYGEDAFVFEVVRTCNSDEVLAAEQQEITDRDATNRERGYNTCPTAGSRRGSVATNSTRQKQSASLRGLKRSEQTRKRMSESGKIRASTQEARAAVSLVHSGKVVSDETKKKLSESHKGKTLSAESRLLISEKMKGRKKSAEAVRNMSIAQRKRRIAAANATYSKDALSN